MRVGVAVGVAVGKKIATTRTATRKTIFLKTSNTPISDAFTGDYDASAVQDVRQLGCFLKTFSHHEVLAQFIVFSVCSAHIKPNTLPSRDLSKRPGT